ncbi:MAG: DUF1080 domain-containing protein [Planctomycetota bacterium]
MKLFATRTLSHLLAPCMAVVLGVGSPAVVAAESAESAEAAADKRADKPAKKPKKNRGKWYYSGLKWQEPPVVATEKASSKPPADAIVLFDGSDLSAFENSDNWRINNGVATVGRGNLLSKQAFGDCQLHVEWQCPKDEEGSGQGRGNSGIYFMGRYEMQILDSYRNPTYLDGMAGAVYKQTPPLVNAIRPPGEWNVYDIVFTAPRFAEDGEVLSPAYVTAFCNGVLIHNHTRLEGETPSWRMPKYRKHPAKLPLKIQDHGDPVKFRNIWVREIQPLANERIHKPMMDHKRGMK